MKIKAFWVILASIGVIWMANYVYAETQKLNHPVFLNHYIDIWPDQNRYITMYYLANKEDQSVFQYAQLGDMRLFPEQTTMDGRAEEVDQYGGYSLRRVEMQVDDMMAEQAEDQIFDEMNVYFTDHGTVSYPIGQIIIHSNRQQADPFSSSSVFSGNYSDTRMKAAEPLTLDAVNTPFADLLADGFFVKLDSARHSGKDINISSDEEWKNVRGTDVQSLQFPLEFQKEDWLAVKSFAGSELRTALLDLSIELQGKTAAGSPFAAYVYHHQFPDVDRQAVKQLIEQRMGASSDE